MRPDHFITINSGVLLGYDSVQQFTDGIDHLGITIKYGADNVTTTL